jgi:hypothetical protein
MHENPAIVAVRQSKKHICDMDCFIRYFQKRIFQAVVIAVTMALAFLCYPEAIESKDILYKNTILLNLHSTLDSCIFNGFSNALGKELIQDLSSSHFIVQKIPQHRGDLASADSTCLVLSVLAASNLQEHHVLVSICSVRQWASLENKDSVPTLLTDISSIDRQDTVAAVILVARKIEENMRTRYVCNLTIITNPAGAQLSSSLGLSGVSPVTWSIPFGIIDMRAEKKGYIVKTVGFNNPSLHDRDSIFIALSRRMVWHSQLFYPALVFSCASAVCYGLEYHYYNKYRNLGQADLTGNPGQFGNMFLTAQGYEYAGSVLLGISLSFFTVAFFF